MRTLIKAMADTRPFPWDTMVVVGAGTGGRLPAFRLLQAARTLLVEPDPDQRQLLLRVVDPERGEEVLETALDADDLPSAVMHRCSAPGFDGLSAPSRLLEILPNLEVVGHIPVSTCSLRTLATQQGLDRSLRNLLVVDAPGQLGLLEDLEGLRSFSDIVVKSGTVPLYRDDRDSDGLHAWLADAGFELFARDPEDIYPFQIEAFRRNDARIEVAGLRSGLEAAHEQLAQARTDAEQESEQSAAREAQHARTVTKLESELAATREQLAQVQAEAKRDAVQSAAREEEHTKAIAELELGLAATCEQLEHARAEAERESGRSRALEEEHARTIAELQSELASTREQLEHARAEAERESGRFRTLEDDKTREVVELGAALAAAREQQAQALAEAKREAEQSGEREARNAKAIAELEAALSAAREGVSKGQSRIAEMEGIGKALEEEKQQLLRTLDAQSAERDQSARKSEEQQKSLAELKQRLQDLDGELRNARETMALAVRMQTLRENDLEELRQRYSDLHGAHQSQQLLLAKLSRRLVAANEYFQQLASDGVALIEPVAAPGTSAARKSRKRKTTRRADPSE